MVNNFIRADIERRQKIYNFNISKWFEDKYLEEFLPKIKIENEKFFLTEKIKMLDEALLRIKKEEVEEQEISLNPREIHLYKKLRITGFSKEDVRKLFNEQTGNNLDEIKFSKVFERYG
jgi:hypothetical protein